MTSKDLKHLSITILALPFIYGISILPWFLLYRVSDGIFFILYHLSKYRRAVVYDNLKRSFPEKSEAEIRQIEKDFYRNLSDIFVETFKFFTISRKQIMKHFKFTNPEVYQHYHEQQKSIMLTTSHYANWEYALSIKLWVPQNPYGVYTRLENKYFNKIFLKSRLRFGGELFPIEETYSRMLAHKQGNNLYGFISDQTPHKNKIKYRLRFLNQDTAVHLGAENLSKKLDMAVLYLDIQRVKRGYYEVHTEVLFDEAKTTEKYEITNKYFEHLEAIIRRKPSDWLWSHRRWKY